MPVPLPMLMDESRKLWKPHSMLVRSELFCKDAYSVECTPITITPVRKSIGLESSLASWAEVMRCIEPQPSNPKRERKTSVSPIWPFNTGICVGVCGGMSSTCSSLQKQWHHRFQLQQQQHYYEPPSHHPLFTGMVPLRSTGFVASTSWFPALLVAAFCHPIRVGSAEAETQSNVVSVCVWVWVCEWPGLYLAAVCHSNYVIVVISMPV